MFYLIVLNICFKVPTIQNYTLISWHNHSKLHSHLFSQISHNSTHFQIKDWKSLHHNAEKTQSHESNGPNSITFGLILSMLDLISDGHPILPSSSNLSHAVIAIN